MAAVIVALMAAFRISGLERYLSIPYIKASHAKLASFYAGRPIAVIAVYVTIYVIVTSLSLPGAAVLTLAGGALFGLWVGAFVVSFASTIGAALACLVSRFVLRDWVQSRFGDRLAVVNKGIEREGAFYLFTLRLIPVFPFFVINLVMGLTELPLSTFYWVSQLGMFPGTLVYVNAGKELAKISSLSGVLSPGLIVSFVLIGLFPVLARKALGFYRIKRGPADAKETPRDEVR